MSRQKDTRYCNSYAANFRDRTLGVEWSEVASYLDADDLKSWQGAKKVITHRLKDLIKENDQSAREELAGEADKWIDYLYYAAKRMRRQVTRARKALDE